MSLFDKLKGTATSLIEPALHVLTGGVSSNIKALLKTVTMPETEKRLLQDQIDEAVEEGVQSFAPLLERQIDSATQVMLAELQHASPVVSHTRPAIALLLTVFVCALVWQGKTVPEELWWVYGGLTSTWMVSRGMEKMGWGGRFSGFITGKK